MRLWTLISLIAVYCIVASFVGCSCEDDPLPHITDPFNLTIEINEGLPTTRDTLLRIQLTGENVYQFQLSTDSTFEGVEWEYFLGGFRELAVPRIEGKVTVYVRFASSSGGITVILKDDIYLDFTAIIHQITVAAHAQRLYPGDKVGITVRTGEEGSATISFANAILNHRLEYVGNGIFRDSITIPHGVISDAARTTAYFTDAAGNVADPVVALQTLVIAGTMLSPQLVGVVHTDWSVGFNIVYSGGFCFVSEDNYVHVLDLDDLTNPHYHHRIECGDYVFGMQGDGSNLFVARGNQIVVIDIRPPETASIKERKQISGTAHDIWLDHPFSYVATFFEGLQVKDIRNPQNIQDLSKLITNFTGEQLTVNRTTAYMIGEVGLTVIEIGNRARPLFRSELNIPGSPQDIAYYNNRLYLTTMTRGVVVINVTDPMFTEIEREFRNFGEVADLIISPPYMYISGENSIRIVNITDPNLSVIGRVGEIEGSHGMFILDRHLIVAGRERLVVIELFH